MGRIQHSARGCVVCGNEYIPKTHSQKYCSKTCWRSIIPRKEPKIWENRFCIVCKTKFNPVTANHKYCSIYCRYQRQLKSYITKESIGYKSGRSVYSLFVGNTRTVGFYVYGWCHPDKVPVPFYVGKGIGNRAWAKHKEVCERYRKSDTVIFIYRDGLTEEGAKLVESVLIQLFSQMTTLVNQSPGIHRGDKSCLEMAKLGIKLTKI